MGFIKHGVSTSLGTVDIKEENPPKKDVQQPQPPKPSK